MASEPRNPASEKVDNGVFTRMRVTCPHCQLPGVFSLDRLQPKTRVRCRRCQQWFRFEALGRIEKADAPNAAIAVSVRGGLSEWTEHLAPESGRLGRRAESAPETWQGYVNWRWGIVAGAALLLVAGIAWRLVSGGVSQAQAVDYQEPEALADRAAAFSLAWVCKDAATMARFTAPSESGALGNWQRLATGQLPATLQDVAPSEVQAGAPQITHEDPASRAIVTVSLQLRGAAPPKDAAGYSHRQAWGEIDGKWLFLPEETCKLLKSPGQSPWK